ncbi:MAG TPA: hypothetical protein VI298_09950 [Geobacteraceae bacterium]
MKKTLMILGGIFLAILVAGVVGFVFIATKGSALDKDSKQYVDTAVPAIVSQWNKQELINRAGPELMKTVKDNDFEKLFTMFRKLGAFKKYTGSEGQANISVTSKHGKVTTAAYVAKADFENGPAEIQVTLIKHADKWQILGFRINSKVFLE